ncbi:hypothetical protein EV426DRAFT_576139 [Tirmania nivea]|nr:hypothetical protein EV426DRAFT_576139 [Tirmania nivea]
MESSNPTDVPQPPAPLWVPPRGKNRLAPTKQEYSDSMGIDVTAYSEIAALAKLTVQTSGQNLLDIDRWSFISAHDKSAYLDALQQQINALKRSDIDIVRARCKDQNILDHFAQEGWQRGRIARRRGRTEHKNGP